MLESFRGEDYEYIYDGLEDDDGKNTGAGNRFAYLGNGFSTKELDKDSDSTWYLN